MNTKVSPLIAVPGRPLAPGQVKGWHLTHSVAAPDRYIRALHRAGAHEAVLLPVPISLEEATLRLQAFDGLLLMGGGDVDPALYGEAPHEQVSEVHPERDTFELNLARAAAEIGLPTLAICRGMQAINVALGGTLIQHITREPHTAAETDPYVDHGGGDDYVPHPVNVAEGSKVKEATNGSIVACSSHHHQAIAKIAPGFRPTAWSEDGIVEAIERESAWMVGVQWHPEVTAGEDPAQQGLFDLFVRRAAEHMQSR